MASFFSFFFKVPYVYCPFFKKKISVAVEEFYLLGAMLCSHKLRELSLRLQLAGTRGGQQCAYSMK